MVDLIALTSSSLSHMSRAEPDLHAYNIGRFDLYPHLSLPMVAGGWSLDPEVAFRETFYSGSENIFYAQAVIGRARPKILQSFFNLLKRGCIIGSVYVRRVVESELAPDDFPAYVRVVVPPPDAERIDDLESAAVLQRFVDMRLEFFVNFATHSMGPEGVENTRP